MSDKQHQLEKWEVALIRAMLKTGKYTKQQILAYFTRPERSINQGRIYEIENDHERYRGIDAAPDESLSAFLNDWQKISFPNAPALPLGPVHPEMLTANFPKRIGAPLRLDASETSHVEGKESFNWGSRVDYCKTMAGMANNAGGYILFGTKDNSFEVTGIADNRMEKFDLKKANQFISRSFNQSLNLEKGQFKLDEKTIGVLYVHPSQNKPVICTVDSGELSSGDIYYRYPGETRRIQAAELEQVLRERYMRASDRALKLVGTLAETDAHNAAIINLGTGEVEGEQGRFIIEEGLLDKIKFITEGKLVEDDGAPTLRVVGDVQPIGNANVTIEKSVVGSITELHIHEAFLYQKCQYEPIAYIQAQTHLQPLWLPIYFFALKAGLDLSGLINVVRKSESPYEQRIQKHIERIQCGRLPTGQPAEITVASELDTIKSGEPIPVEDLVSAKKVLQAVRLLTPDDVKLSFILSILTDLRARFGSNQQMRTDLRYALAAVDLKWFRSKI